ncbi:MAG: hypothetical protein ACFFA3_19575 [Promethearchaeota archaeon]
MKKSLTGLIIIIIGITAVATPLSLIPRETTQDKLSNPNDLPNKEDPNNNNKDKDILEACVDINPNTLNFKSNGKWITIFIHFSNEKDINTVQFESIKVNDSIFADKAIIEIGEGNEFDKLIVKFDRKSVINFLEPAEVVEITISGKFNDGVKFKGEDSINLINY